VQEGFGRNAAPIETDAAESFILLDEEDFFAEIGGIKRGGVTARACARTKISV